MYHHECLLASKAKKNYCLLWESIPSDSLQSLLSCFMYSCMNSMCCLTDLHETHQSDQDRNKEEIKLVNVNVWIEFVVWRGVRREKIAGGKKC